MASVLAAIARTDSIALAPGTLVADQYRIERPIGEGGMGVVFLARDVHLDRSVAVKVCTGLSSSAVHRIQREAIALAKLAHPNVVVLFQAGALDERFFIAMEHVQGCNARQWLERAPRTWQEIVDVYAQAARGLHAAHRVGIVHRDFKPDNVLVGDDGRVRVADFGLAQTTDELVADRERLEGRRDPLSSRTSLTRTGGAPGTPAYMAPEQAMGRPLDAAADQFAFCVALYEALWGVRPSWDMPLDMLPAPSTAKAVPRRLHEIVRRGLCADPHQRWPSMHVLMQALVTDPSAQRRRLGLTLAGLLAVGTSAWLVGSSARPEPCTALGSAIDGTWSAARRDEVVAALRGTGWSISPAMLEPVTTALDGWANEWSAERLDACEATRLRGEQSEARMDQRMDCLDRMRVEGAAIIDVLLDPDREVVVRAAAIVERLPDPSQCSDAEALDATEVVPPARRPVFDTLHARLAEANAAYSAGRVDQHYARADELVAAAEAEGFEGLAAKARTTRALACIEQGRLDDAVADASTTIAYALRAHDDALLASAALTLATALGRASSTTDDALRWLGVAEAAAEHQERGLVREARLASARVQILLFGDRLAEAERVARQALASVPEDDSARFILLTALGSSLHELGRYDEAIATHHEAIAFAEHIGKSDHPSIAAPLGNLAQTLQLVGRGQEAFPLIERVLAIRVAAYGEDSPAAADGHRQLGDAYLEVANLPAARVEYERALAIHRARHDEAGQVLTLGNLAIVLNNLGDTASARDALLEALPLAEHRFGASSRRVVQLSVNLSGYLLELGRVDEAAAYGERAVALGEQLEGEPQLAIGAAINLAQIYGRQHRTADALALLDRTAVLCTTTLPTNAPEGAHVLLSRAMVLRDAGRLEEAAEIGAQAAQGMERARGPTYHETITAQHAAGRGLLEAGHPERARTLLERALEATEVTTVAPDLVVEIRWLLAQALWPEPAQREHARALARSAYAELRGGSDPRAREVEAWLASRGGTGPTRASASASATPARP